MKKKVALITITPATWLCGKASDTISTACSNGKMVRIDNIDEWKYWLYTNKKKHTACYWELNKLILFFTYPGKTYFFKGKGFWKFNDLQMRVENEKQFSSATFWMGCATERTGRRAGYKAPPAPGSTLRSPSAATTITTNLLPFLYSTLLLLSTYIRYC